MSDQNKVGSVSGWRGIGSAPKDGTRVLIYEAHTRASHGYRYSREMTVAQWHQPANTAVAGYWCATPAYPAEPTHWMPLPAPPTESAR